jgi:hypothetical protein
MHLLPWFPKCYLMPTLADSFAQVDPKTSKQFFDGTHYNSCHMKIGGGDSSGIFTRLNNIIPTTALLNRIHYCETQISVRWTAAEETHDAAFLNQTYYPFP